MAEMGNQIYIPRFKNKIPKLLEKDPSKSTVIDIDYKWFDINSINFSSVFLSILTFQQIEHIS